MTGISFLFLALVRSFTDFPSYVRSFVRWVEGSKGLNEFCTDLFCSALLSCAQLCYS